MRVTARAPQPPTNPPTGHQMSRPKMNKNANFGQKILIFPGEIKSFVTHITENPPRHLVHIVFWSGIGQNVQKWQYLAQNDQKCIFWTKFGRFWAKNPNFYGSK